MKDRVRPLRISPHRMSQLAGGLVLRYNEELGEIARLGMSFDLLYEHVIYPDYEIDLREGCDLGFDENGVKLLGKYDPSTNTAYLDKCVERDPRRTFTLFHEVVGHGVLQGEWLRSEFDRLQRTAPLAISDLSLHPACEDALEQQANRFAAQVAAPASLLRYWYEQRFGTARPVMYTGPGTYFRMTTDPSSPLHVSDYQDLCRLVGSQLRPFFSGLSTEALSYRISELGIVEDYTRPRIALRRTEKERSHSTRPFTYK